MTEIKIYLDISTEGLDAIEQNSIDINEVLSNEGIKSKVEKGFVNFELENGFRFKDPITIIIASSAAVVSIGFAISQVIATLNNKKQAIILDSLEELRDKDNNIILDKDGKPVFKTVKSIEIIDPAKKESSNYLLEWAKVFRLRISSK